MPKFENKPYSKDDYDKNAEDTESLKKQMAGAKTADEMMAIAMKMKAAEGNENELMGNAQEEAGKENKERKAYDEAAAEDTERNMYDEAKVEDAERTTAKESEKMDADLENLKGQIVGAKNADEMMKIAEKIKEIEEKKKGIGTNSQKEEVGVRAKELEELKLKDKTESAEKVEEILKKLNGEIVSEETQREAPESEQIDAVALNNKIVNMRDEKAKAETLKNMTPQEISAVAKNIAKSDWEHTLSFLDNFRNKPEIIAQPEITEKFKKMLSSGRIHLYDVERILNLPGTEEIFNDPEVQKGVENSVRSFVVNLNPREKFENVSDALDRVVKGANVSNQGLRNIAEEIKGNSDAFQSFVRHFGAKRIYPEL